MKILIKLLLLLSLICNAQRQTKCNPKNLDSISNLVIKEMSLRSLDKIKNSNKFDNYTLSSEYIYNFEDYQPIISFLEEHNVINSYDHEIEYFIELYTYHKLKKKAFCFKEIAKSKIDTLKKYQNKRVSQQKLSKIDNIYIPKNINEAFKCLDSLLTKEEQKIYSGKVFDSIGHSYYFGKRIRYIWRLTNNSSRFSNYFEDLGITFSENMSYIIFKCYSKYLNNKPIELTKEVNNIKNMQRPKLKDFPKQVRNVTHYNTINIGDWEYSKKTIFAHLYTNQKGNEKWLYENKYGWKIISENQIEEITSIHKYKKGVRWLKKFYNY